MTLHYLMDALRGSGLPVGFAEDTRVYVPAALLRTMLESQFREMRVEIGERGDRSSVSFPSALNLPELTFRSEIGRMSLRSQRTFVTLREPEPENPNGAVELDIWLEPVEGVGKPAALSIRLGLTAALDGATYDRVQVTCAAENREVEHDIATCVEAFFYWAYTREAVSGTLGAAVRQAVGDSEGVLDVMVDGARLSIWRCRL